MQNHTKMTSKYVISINAYIYGKKNNCKNKIFIIHESW